MKPLQERLSPRAIRALYVLLAGAVFALTMYNGLHVMLWRVPSNDQCQWMQHWSDSTRPHLDAIAPGSSAATAGLLPGDILLAVDGTPVTMAAQAQRLLADVRPGARVPLRIERDHRPREIAWGPGAEETRPPFVLTDRIFETLVITNIVPGGVTDRAGIRDGDILLRIDGVSINTRYGASYLINIHPAGSTATFLVDRDGERMEFDVRLLKTFNLPYFSGFLLGLGFLVVGVFVVLVRPDGSIQRKFARYGMYTMLMFGMMNINIGGPYDPAWKSYTFFGIGLLTRCLAPPALLAFFLHFPAVRSLPRRRLVMVLLYIAAIVPALLLAVNAFRVDWFFVPVWMVLTAYYFPFAFFLAGLALFAHSYFRYIAPEQRRPLRPILHSAIIGIATFTYIVVLNLTHPLVLYLDPILMVPALLIVGIPPAFAYAIIRHRLMDMTPVVRRSLIYGIVTAALAAIYLGVVFGLGSLLGHVLGQADNTLLILVAVIAIALLFDPLKQRVQQAVDRIFYQERINYQKALREFSSELPRLMNLAQILDTVVDRIAAIMRVENVSVTLCDEREGCHAVARGVDAELCTFDHRRGGVIGLLESTRVPQRFELIDENTLLVDAEDREKVKQSGMVLMVPMFLQDRLIGSINVGPKRSGRVYSEEDIDLLATVAGQAAIAIENARLHRSEIEKEKITEQLKIAQRIQQGLLPKNNPSVARLDIAGTSIPAQTVGGDYYDYIELPDNRLLVAVGDVSGKGMPAALYMSKVQGMIRFAAQISGHPKDMLIRVNRLICEGMERNSFITIILALFDFNADTVTICRAGHTPPLVALNGTLSFLGSEGMGLGLENGPVFEDSLEEREFALVPDGLIVLYSDGLTEAMDTQRNEFGEERVLELARHATRLSAADLQRRLIDAAQHHRGAAEQNDDITLVVIRVR
ncbi:MAG: SpoIIE family protein phosphatase [Bacteroidota bacterium]|jgi:sigma-B regulation protein RsbU (phosphoserine phosphatase)|nr:SpoIIE family protein phosphatase [Bacteroidota bacterium]